MLSFLNYFNKKEINKELTEENIQEIIIKEIEKFFEQSQILKIIIKNDGVLHGACIRDIILNIKPDNINIIINSDNLLNLIEDFKKIGYEYDYNNPFIEDKDILIKNNNISIEIIIDTDNKNNKPDFDIDVLTYDGSCIYNWVDDLWKISEVYKKILKKEAKPLDTYYSYNIKNKGFKLILNPSNIF